MRKQHLVVWSESPARPAAHADRPSGRSAPRPDQARILRKTNQGEAGPGWTDRAIAAALQSTTPPGAGPRAGGTGGLDAAVDRTAPDRQDRHTLDGVGGPLGRAGGQHPP